MKFVDDSKKDTKWWNRNYFWVGTLVVVLLNVFIFIFANEWAEGLLKIPNLEDDPNNFVRTIVSFFAGLSHGGSQHLIFNMICFSICGFYIERKTGSLGLIGLVFAGLFFSGCITSQNLMSCDGWLGFSGTNFFIYAFIFVDYFFSLTKDRRSKTNIILGAICFSLVYLVDVGVQYVDAGGLAFGSVNILPVIYPWNLIYNACHYSGFIAGLIFTLAIELSIIFVKKSYKNR